MKSILNLYDEKNSIILLLNKKIADCQLTISKNYTNAISTKKLRQKIESFESQIDFIESL